MAYQEEINALPEWWADFMKRNIQESERRSTAFLNDRLRRLENYQPPPPRRDNADVME